MCPQGPLPWAGCDGAAGAEAWLRRYDVIQLGRTCTGLYRWYAGDHSVVFKFRYYYGDSCYYMTLPLFSHNASSHCHFKSFRFLRVERSRSGVLLRFELRRKPSVGNKTSPIICYYVFSFDFSLL